MTVRMQVITSLIVLCILLGGAAGCAPRSTEATALPDTQPTVPPATLPAPTLPALQPGWETHSASADGGVCGYAIDHPSEMDVSSQGTYNWLLSITPAESNEPYPNFIYISVIPDGLPESGSEPGVIYNYDPAETQTLLNMQVGESRSLRDDPNIAPSFTYTRLPDTALGGQPAQTYENTQPWEFPPGTKEIRYYLKAQGCTFLMGGYLSTVGSGQPGAIGEELFDEIIATFRLSP